MAGSSYKIKNKKYNEDGTAISRVTDLSQINNKGEKNDNVVRPCSNKIN